MKVFTDRIEAGRSLASKLDEFSHSRDAVVLAIPRDGVVVGYEVAHALRIPLDIIIPSYSQKNGGSRQPRAGNWRGD